MDTEQATERTPLIEHQTSSANNAISFETLPFVLDLEKSIYTDSEYPAIHAIIERQVDSIEATPTTRVALKLLLCLRYLSGAYFHLGQDTWFDARPAEHDVVDLSLQFWKDLQGLAWSQTTFDEALWLQFPLENGKEVSISLIEAVFSGRMGIPLSIQLDDQVALSLLRAWKTGKPRSVQNAPGSSTNGLLHRIEGFATPRVLHLLDLAFYLVSIAVLAHYLIRPLPAYPPDLFSPDYHFYWIAAYTLCRFLNDPWSPSNTSFILTFTAFLLALPSMPRKRENSFNLLLFAFFLHIIQLLLPLSPSFSLLEPRSTSFAVSAMLQNLIDQVFIPTFVFFIPVIFMLLFILSASLNEIFLVMDQTPLATFDLFLFTLWCSGLLFTCLAGYMTLSSSSLLILPPNTHHPRVPAIWYTYGTSVGVSLRRHLCRIAVTYSTPYFFPAPINLLPLIFVRFPYAFLRLLGEKQVAPWLRDTLEPVVWTLLVSPLVFVFGPVWFWK